MKGRKITVLATGGVEQVELTAPVKALREAGVLVHVVAPKEGKIQGFNHDQPGDLLSVDLLLKTLVQSHSTHWSCLAGSPTPTSCGRCQKQSGSCKALSPQTNQLPLFVMVHGL
jgi:putative intracellular protease/amidase